MSQPLLHQRAQIRQFVADLLRQGMPELATRIHANRYKPLWASDDSPPELPAIMVYTRSESSSLFDEAPRRYKRELALVVEALVLGDENTDDTIDDLCKRVESIFFVNDRMGELSNDVLLGTTEMDINVEGEFVFASAKMVWNVIYFTDAPDITQIDALKDLNLVNYQIKAQVGADQGTTGVAELDGTVNIPE